jgi:hypothetical protein
VGDHEPLLLAAGSWSTFAFILSAMPSRSRALTAALSIGAGDSEVGAEDEILDDAEAAIGIGCCGTTRCRRVGRLRRDVGTGDDGFTRCNPNAW